jgi:hypothetical protein
MKLDFKAFDLVSLHTITANGRIKETSYMPRKSQQRESESVYSVHPSVKMIQSWIASLPDKTGRSLEEWVKLVKRSGPRTEEERAEWMKKEHNLGSNMAWWIAGYVDGKGVEDGNPESYLKSAPLLVDAMFSGPKESLRPIFEKLLKVGKKLGKDVRVCPCKTIVPMFRRHVFAEIKPATRTRIDLGLALLDMKGGGRLIETGGYAKRDRITHKIGLSSVDEIDDEVKNLLKIAYDLDK